MEFQNCDSSANEYAQRMEHPALVNGSSLAATNYQQNGPEQKEQFNNPPFESSNYQSSLSPTSVNVANLNIDPESVKGFDFTDDTIRRKFIRKVFTLLSIQMVFTFSWVLLVSHNNGVRTFMESHPMIAFLSFIVLLGTLITISCNEAFRRTHPTNLICLVVITVSQTILLGYVACYDANLVLTAIGLLAIVVMGLYAFAKQTKYDFTQYNGILFGALFVFIIASIVSIAKPNDTFIVFMCGIGVLLFSIHFIHDIQLIVAGEHKYKLSPEEHILATLILYIDLVHLFHYILRLLHMYKKLRS